MKNNQIIKSILITHAVPEEIITACLLKLQSPILRATVFKDFDNFEFENNAREEHLKQQGNQLKKLKSSITILKEALEKTIKLGRLLDDYPKFKFENKLNNVNSPSWGGSSPADEAFFSAPKYIKKLTKEELFKAICRAKSKDTDQLSPKNYRKYKPKESLTGTDLNNFNHIVKFLEHWITFGFQYYQDGIFDGKKQQLPIKKTFAGKLDHRWWKATEKEFDEVLRKFDISARQSAQIFVAIARDYFHYPKDFLHQENTVYKRILSLRKQT